MSLKINICAPLFEPSGYGEFARSFIYALHKRGTELRLQDIPLKTQFGDYGQKQELCKSLLKLGKTKCEFNVVFMVAPLFARHLKPGVKNIGFTMWETDRLPQTWVDACNAMDAIFVPSEWNAEIFKACGVKVPISVVHPGIENEHETSYNKDSTFKFLSVFQWTERKNPQALLKAYLTHFAKTDNSSLLIKTYGQAGGASIIEGCKKSVRDLISDLKLDPANVADIKFVPDIISHKAMSSLYDECNAYVSSHRGEGWGLPLMEAMMRGKNVIATNYSANREFMSEENSWLIPYQLTPAVGMGNYVPWINGTMWWADIDIKKLGETMRKVYEGAEKGALAKYHIKEQFNYNKSAEQFERAILSQRKE